MQRDLGITTVFVTHDQEEALSISDRIVVMNRGAPIRSPRRPTSTTIRRRASWQASSARSTFSKRGWSIRRRAAYSIDGQPVATTRDLSAFGIADETTVALRPGR